jgi:hypothetical protein
VVGLGSGTVGGDDSWKYDIRGHVVAFDVVWFITCYGERALKLCYHFLKHYYMYGVL